MDDGERVRPRSGGLVDSPLFSNMARRFLTWLMLAAYVVIDRGMRDFDGERGLVELVYGVRCRDEAAAEATGATRALSTGGGLDEVISQPGSGYAEKGGCEARGQAGRCMPCSGRGQGFAPGRSAEGVTTSGGMRRPGRTRRGVNSNGRDERGQRAGFNGNGGARAVEKGGNNSAGREEA